MREPPSLLWFRQDLRLSDNPALAAALERRAPIVPVFIWAPEEEGPWPPGSASRWWLGQSLARLSADLGKRGSRLIVRRGPTAAALSSLVAESGASAVFWNRRPIFLPRGRTAAGARNHCLRGKDVAMTETILDWRRFDYFTVEKTVQQLWITTRFRVTSRLEAAADRSGTSFTALIKIVTAPMLPFIRPLCGPLLTLYGIDKRYQKLSRLAAR